ncbi:TPA: hypothetical protein ACIRVE_005115 [Pseudomonas putida]
MHLKNGWLALCAVAVLAGCSTKPVPPPEPDMTKLVIVNKVVPVELIGPGTNFSSGGRQR